MSSTADALRRSLRVRMAAMSADERLALTGRLAETDLELFCGRHGIARDEGRAALKRRRQVGRLTSRVMLRESA